MSTDDGPLLVKIGDAERPIPPFRGFKAARAGTLLARVADEVQRLWVKADDYEVEYRTKHTMRFTREEANFRGWDHIVFPGDKAEGREPQPTDYIEIPSSPTDERKFMTVFQEAFKLIQNELVQLLALVLAPNEELEAAYESEAEGGVDGYLEKKATRLLFDANLGQMVDVALATRQLLEREFEGKEEGLAGLRDLLRGGPMAPEEDQTPEEEPSTAPSSSTAPTPELQPGLEEEDQPAEPQPSSPTQPEAGKESGNGSPPSSTPSQAPTDGPDGTSSLASHGPSYANSETG